MNDQTRFLLKKFIWAVLMGLFCTGSYLFTNHFRFFTPVIIENSFIDNSVPYLPWTILVYYSYYLLFLAAMMWCDNDHHLYTMVKSYATIIMISCIIFLFFPTSYKWQHASQDDFFTYYFYSPLEIIQTSYNACPSLHVSLSFAGAFVYLWYKKHSKMVICGLWGILIALSTLTVKQHFFIDIVTGTTLSFLVSVVMFRISRQSL